MVGHMARELLLLWNVIKYGVIFLGAVWLAVVIGQSIVRMVQGGDWQHPDHTHKDKE